MNNSAMKSFTGEYRLVFGYSVKFSYSPGTGINAEWLPDTPHTEVRRGRRKKLFKEYYAARDKFMAGVVEELGNSVCVIDYDTDRVWMTLFKTSGEVETCPLL